MKDYIRACFILVTLIIVLLSEEYVTAYYTILLELSSIIWVCYLNQLDRIYHHDIIK